MSRIRFLSLLTLFTLLAVVIAGSSFSTAVAENLKFKASLRGGNEVPPRATSAMGSFRAELSEDGSEIHYTLVLKKISNAVAAHIHVGDATVNGPVVAFLYGNVSPGSGFEKKIVVSGVITADDLIGPLAGMPLSALVDQMTAGNTYVNAHTNDGIDPINTGPGDFPGGEIRGQIELR